MSGVEIAGLVLGGFPLLVSALEHYREGFEPLKEWWMFRREFMSFIDDVGTQKIMFDNNLEKLLNPFIESDREMNDLLNSPKGPAWRQPALELKLKQRLLTSYDWYMKIITKMNTVIKELKLLLGIESGEVGLTIRFTRQGLNDLPLDERTPPEVVKAFRPCRICPKFETDFASQIKWIDSDSGSWDYQMKRIRISFSKKKFKRVKILAKYNDELAKLLGASDDLAPSRERRKSSPSAIFFQKVQDHANSLHAALKARWHCPCLTHHDANLQLEKRTKDRKPGNPKFQLVFTVEKCNYQTIGYSRTDVGFSVSEDNGDDCLLDLENLQVDHFANLQKQFESHSITVSNHASPSTNAGLQPIPEGKPGSWTMRSSFFARQVNPIDYCTL